MILGQLLNLQKNSDHQLSQRHLKCQMQALFLALQVILEVEEKIEGFDPHKKTSHQNRPEIIRCF